MQCGDHVFGQHLILAGVSCGVRREIDGVSNQQSIGAGHAGVFAFITAGDHDACRNFHFTENVATGAFQHIVIIGIDVERFLGVRKTTRAAAKLNGVGKRWQAHVRVRVQGNLIHGESVKAQMLTQ